MKIKVLMTDKAMQRPVMDDRERMLSAAVSSGVEISVDCIKKGPDELDCHTDEAFAAPELIKMAIQAEKDGYDAIVIYCFSDVGLEALRENVKIPVIAPGEVTLSVAQTLCSRFFVTGGAVNLAREEQTVDEFALQGWLQVTRVEEIVLNSVARANDFRILHALH